MTNRLRSVGFHERVRRERPRLRTRAWRNLRDHARLMFVNFMRPLAVPALGGVFSAVTLFNLWVVPAYPVQAKPGSDVPTRLNTDASVQDPFAMRGVPGTFAVDVLVDDQGRPVDYAIIPGGFAPDAIALRNLENLLLYGKFRPATKFGKPIMGKIRLEFSSIEVKG
jgi:hypothetical protein